MNQPKYRRPLNNKQLAILHTIYRFRFVTSPLIAQLFNIKPSKAHARLTILLDQLYIGRRYDKTYQLQGKAAAYHLLQKGADALAATGNKDYLSAVLKRLTKDLGRADRFVEHWQNVLDVYCRLTAHYGDRLKFFTTTQLVAYPYLIQPRPDAYFRIDDGPNERQFFLDYLDSAMPRYAIVGRVRQYVEYAEEEDWPNNTNTSLPTVILVCANPGLAKRLSRLVKAELEDSWATDDLKIHLTTKDEILPLK